MSDEEMEHADVLLEKLINEIPQVESSLQRKYNNSLDYKYYLGKHLHDYITSEGIKERERLYFWREIEDFASTNDNPNSESDQRHFYEYCYTIYTFGYDIAHALTYREWNDILARKKIRQDERIFKWFLDKKTNHESLNWRSLLPTLNSYLTKTDTSVFSDQELFAMYDKLHLIAYCFDNFVKEYGGKNKSNLTPARRKHFSKYKKKYISEALQSLRENRLDEKYLEKIFSKIFLTNMKSS